MIKLKVVNKSKNELPEYAHPGDSGLDIRANLEEAVILQPLERKLIPTGIYVVLNTPGTIDAKTKLCVNV